MTSGLIEMIEAQADCLKSFSQYLQTCANIDDVRNMERLFKAYQHELEDGEMQTNEVLPELLMKVAVQLNNSGGDPEKGEHAATGFKIALDLHMILQEAFADEKEFLAKLLDSIERGHRGPLGERVSLRDSVIAFVNGLDAPKAAPRAPRRQKGGHRKAA